MRFSRRGFLSGAAAFSVLGNRLSADARNCVYEGDGGLATDSLLARRLFLDICGRLPSREEAEAFVNSTDGDKLQSLVQRLLASDGFADYWSMHYADILRVKSEFPINLWPNAVYVYHRRIRAALAADEPWDDFAIALLTAKGSNFRVGEVNFLRATARRTSEGISEAVTTSFLTSPTERYAPFFSRVAFKPTREWKEEIVYLKDGDEDLTPAAFAEKLTEGDLRDDFILAHVRHIHWWLFGCMPTPEREEKWVEALTEGGLRLKPFLVRLFTSRDYRLGPKSGAFPPRRLDAEVIDDAICDLTGLQHEFVSIAPEPFTYIPKDRRSILLEDGSITSPFLLLFGRPARDTGLLAERNNAISAKQRLYLFNSGRLANQLNAMMGSSRYAKVDRANRIIDLYWRFLSRPPTDDETTFIDSVRLSPRDVAWMLLNSREFLYRI